MPHRLSIALLMAVLGAAAHAGPLEDALRRAAEGALRKAAEPAPVSAPAPIPAPTTSTPPAPAPTVAQSPAAWPVSDAERSYVAPQATQRISPEPRRMGLGNSAWGQKFSVDPVLPQVTLANPYLDPARLVLTVPKNLQCLADGAVLVGAEGGIDASARTIGIGYWRVAPDGAVTPVHTRSTKAYGKTGRTICDAPYGKTRLGTPRPALQDDGSLVAFHAGTVLRIRADGAVERIAGSPKGCEPDNTAGLEGFDDGGPDQARFKDLNQVVAGAAGQVWAVDQRGCALRRIEADGRTSTVIGPDQLCAKGTPPGERPVLHFIAWDPVHGELVSAGAQLTHNQLYTTVWRIRPDGQARRVLLGHKLGKSPAGAQLDGTNALAIDAQGRIHIGSRRMENDQLAILRVDETKGSVVPLTGMAVAAGTSLQGQSIDGPAARARFTQMRDMCIAPDGTTYVLDEILLRRLDRSGQVTTWAF